MRNKDSPERYPLDIIRLPDWRQPNFNHTNCICCSITVPKFDRRNPESFVYQTDPTTFSLILPIKAQPVTNPTVRRPNQPDEVFILPSQPEPPPTPMKLRSSQLNKHPVSHFLKSTPKKPKLQSLKRTWFGYQLRGASIVCEVRTIFSLRQSEGGESADSESGRSEKGIRRNTRLHTRPVITPVCSGFRERLTCRTSRGIWTGWTTGLRKTSGVGSSTLTKLHWSFFSAQQNWRRSRGPSSSCHSLSMV